MPTYTLVYGENPGPIQHPAVTLVDEDGVPVVLGTAGGGGTTSTILEQSVLTVDAGTYDAANDRLTDLSGTANHARLGSTVGTDSNDPRRQVYDPAVGKYIRFPMVAGNSLSVPDSAALSLTGDRSWAVAFDEASWTASLGAMTLASKSTSSGNQRSWRVDLSTAGNPALVLSADGATSTTATCSASITTATGTVKEILITWRASDGRVQFFTATAIGGPYTQLGTDATIAIGSTFDNTAPVIVSGYSNGVTQPALMDFYRLRMWSDITQTTKVLDINPADASLVEPYNTFTEQSSNAATVTILRSATGRKTTVVDRTLLLLGTDDYLATADASSLDFTHGASFSTVDVIRFHGAPAANAVIRAKKADLTTGAGYAVYLDTAGRVNGIIADGTTSVSVRSAAPLSAGVRHVIVFVRDADNDVLRLIIDGSPSDPVLDTTTGSLANAEELRIGRLSGAGTSYGDFVSFAHLVLPIALLTTDAVQLEAELLLDVPAPYVPVNGVYAVATSKATASQVAGDAYARYERDADGTMWLGDGSSPPVRVAFVSRNLGGLPSAGAQRTFYGWEAGLNCTQYNNTFFGFRAGKNASGRSNTAIGNNALSSGYVGNEVVAVGNGAMASATTGGLTSTAVGTQALTSCDTGNSNQAFGIESLSFLRSGDNNVSVGYYGNASWGDDNTGGPTDQHECTTVGSFNGHVDGLVDGARGARVSHHDSIAFGWKARFDGDYAGAIGSNTRAYADGSWAIGTDNTGAAASTSTANEMKLGTPLHTVYAGKDIRTGQGGLAAAGKWRLGQRVSADIVGGDGDIDFYDGYLEVEVDGTILKLALVA